MPAEDRDRLFEKALQLHLRREATADLDAETLASYHDRLLPVDEMTAVERHVVTCTRCQEILAQLELTQDLHESQDRDKAEVYEHLAAQSAGAPSVGRRQSSGKIAHFTARKISLLRWAAPAGAIAAGILIWIGLRDFRSPSKVASQPAVQIAENRRDAPSSLDSRLAPPEALAKQESERVAQQAYRKQQAAKPSDILLDEMRQPRTAVDPESHARANKELPSKGANGLGAVSGNEVGGRISSEKKESRDASEAATDLDATKSGRAILEGEAKIVAGGSGAVPPSPPPAPARRKAVEPALAAAPAASGVEVADQPMLQKDNNSPAQFSYSVSTLKLLGSTAATPDGKDIWRFGEHGGIAHSSDGGNTWKSQTAPLAATLTSGSAPSHKVCWIAGAAGTLLRTTDGGNRWQIVITPIAADLGGVLASDDRHATIWDVGNHARYATSDGGATWKQAVRE
jgi:hypothetical protein